MLPATWAALTPHLRRNALFVVEPGPELLDVAVAIAADDQDAVKTWIDADVLRRPTLEEVEAWNADPVTFYSVIVQPFVLCRPL